MATTADDDDFFDSDEEEQLEMLRKQHQAAQAAVPLYIRIRAQTDRKMPNETQVATRALCHTVVINRFYFTQMPPHDESHLTGILTDWMLALSLQQNLLPAEAAFFANPANPATKGLAYECLEKLGTLLWALGVIEDMPPYGVWFDQLQANPALQAAPKHMSRADFLELCDMRPRDELERARKIAELWFIRVWVEATIVQERCQGERLPVVAEYIKLKAAEAASLGAFAEPLKDDFPVPDLQPTSREPRRPGGDRTVAETERKDLLTLIHPARERWQTLSWLCGFAEAVGHSWQAMTLGTDWIDHELSLVQVPS
eukprot:TRINITY_DN4713_c0_g1_i2.p1 TRINITY_DN4713_c0_g1~~TRINITY_DN4713_c0_g1_i2.p1  ORF type:complete len:314 (-),score=75.51 TRINITY_DN4713_c0_g1_i2:693-1634(-)